MLSEIELKVLRLALDPAAGEGEWTTAACKLFRLLRKRAARPEELDQNGAATIPVPQTQPDYGLTEMPWGKHKGELFKDISPAYLAWAFDWIKEDPDRAVKMKNLAEAIAGFQAQCR